MNNKYDERGIGRADSLGIGRVESQGTGTDEGFDVGQTGGEIPITELPAGLYWQSGIVEKAPTTGQGWQANLPGLSSSGSITLLEVLASAIAPTSVDVTGTYKGSVSVETIKHGQGTAVWTVQNASSVPWSTHPAYTQESNTSYNPTAPPSRKFWIFQMTVDDVSEGNLQGDALAVT